MPDQITGTTVRRILADRALAACAWWLTLHRRHLVRALKANTARRDRVEERRLG